MTQKLSAFFLLWCTLFWGTGPAVCDETRESREYAIKAAFVYNFAKFVEWPKESLGESEFFFLCVLGESPFGESLAKLQNKIVQGRKIVVRPIKHGEDIGQCHILFVGQSEEDQLAKVIAQMKRKNVLTVGDITGFTRQGGIIGFFIEEQKVRFQINAQAAEEAGLRISSKLLNLAQIVGGGNHKKE